MAESQDKQKETEPRGEFSAAPTIDNQRSSAQSVTHLTSPTVAAKRPRGRPRKRAPDTVVEREVDTATGAATSASAATTADATAGVSTPVSIEIRTAADEATDIAAASGVTALDERTPKRRRARRTAAALDDPITGCTRSRIRREPYRGVDADDRAACDDSPNGARAGGHALVVIDTHSAAAEGHSENSEDGRTHERLDPDLQHSTAAVQFDAGTSEAS
ncbi:unnamed protein product [Phytophthora fragariaefolia]|uniref:Unnamed protein product n=1 Tax=Phytophthora fragariaefolia TaxID=1490495 RepID=A0A9W6TTE7_9STRA|nr:unnamed protein product [Phytophthora fragariaefolia]